MLWATHVPVHGTHLQAPSVQTSIAQPSASLCGSHPSAQLLLKPSMPLLTSPFHIPIFFSHHSLFPFLSLYPCCCEPCPFTFLPSVAISFCIIVLCTEKAKRATKRTPFAHWYPLLCVISPKKPLMKILHSCWLYASGLRISFFPTNA